MAKHSDGSRSISAIRFIKANDMSKRINLKKKLERRELTIGSWLSWGFSPITEVMTRAGFEWLVIDLEHTAIDYAEVHQMIQTIDLAGCVIVTFLLPARRGSHRPPWGHT